MRNEKLGCRTWSLHKIGPKRNQNVWTVDTLYFVLLAQSSLFVNKIIVFKNNSKNIFHFLQHHILHAHKDNKKPFM